MRARVLVAPGVLGVFAVLGVLVLGVLGVLSSAAAPSAAAVDAPSIFVTLDDDVAEIGAGERLHYAASAENRGAAPFEGTLTIAWPTSVSLDEGAAVPEPASVGDGEATWAIRLEPGEAVEIAAPVSVSDPSGSQLIATATVRAADASGEVVARASDVDAIRGAPPFVAVPGLTGPPPAESTASAAPWILGGALGGAVLAGGAALAVAVRRRRTA